MTNKYNATSLYYHLGACYFQDKIWVDGKKEVIYVNKNGRQLPEMDKSSNHYFDSILEFQVWKVLSAWVEQQQITHRGFNFVLKRQVSVPLFEQNQSFKSVLTHKVDFCIEMTTSHSTVPMDVWYIEAKGLINGNTLWILRAIEDKFQWLSSRRYLMVFDELPKKFPRGFPHMLTCPKTKLNETLNDLWRTHGKP